MTGKAPQKKQKTQRAVDDDEWNFSDEDDSSGESTISKATARSQFSTPKKTAKGSPKRHPRVNTNLAKSPKGKRGPCAPLVCLVCPEPRHRKVRWCKLHNAAANAMRAQAKEQGTIDVYNTMMSTDAKAKEGMQEWEKVNPASSKWARKALIDWAGFKKRWGKKESQGVKGKRRKLTKKQFKAWARYKEGMATDSAEEEWAALETSSAKRDHSGRKGQLQIEVDMGSHDFNVRETYIDQAVEVGSQPVKNPKQEDIDGLKNYVHKSVPSSADGFFQGRWNSDAQPEKIEEPAATSARETEEEIEEVVVDSNHRAKIFSTLDEAWDKQRTEVVKNIRSGQACLDELSDHEAEFPELKRDDRAFTSYIETLEFRMKVALIWLGCEDTHQMVDMEDKDHKSKAVPPVAQILAISNKPDPMMIEDGAVPFVPFTKRERSDETSFSFCGGSGFVP